MQPSKCSVLMLDLAALQAITAALPQLRKWASPHVRVGASANGFKKSTTEWLGGGTTPGMVAPEGMACPSLHSMLAVRSSWLCDFSHMWLLHQDVGTLA